MTFKVGFHGTNTGIGTYAFKVNEGKRLVVCKSINNGGWAAACAKLARDSGISHPIVMRWTNPGGGPEVPNYKLKPDIAANEHWALVMKSINGAPELKPYMDLIWFETINEPRTAVDSNDPNYNNMHPSDWLGWFAYYVAQHAKRDGVRWAAFGMNAGTPEKEDWRRGGMVEFLRECAANPDKLAVALHEYTFDLGSFSAKSPYLVGRFQWLYQVCDELKIARPTTLITELGWAYNDLPQATALADIQWYGQLISSYPTIKGAYLWSLEGLPPLKDKLTALLEPVTSLALSSSPPSSNGGPPPPSCRGVPREQYARVYRVVPGHVDLPVREAMYIQAARDNITIGPSYDDAGLGDLDNRTAELYGINTVDRQTFIDWYAKHYPGVKVVFKALPTQKDPLDGLKLGAPFQVPFVLTSPFNAQRDYANKLHEGADYDIMTQEPDSKEPVLACLSGTVSRSENKGTAYGHFVVIDSTYNGEPIAVWYAHMDARYVQAGQTVKQGDRVGELGGTNTTGQPRFAEHVHINLTHQGTGLDGYAVAKVRDPHPFMTMTPVKPPSTGYTGPTVTFVPGVDQPASDWYWTSAKSVFDNTGRKLAPKFHDTGDSHKWFADYKHPNFNVVRVTISPSFNNRDPQAIWNEMRGGINKYWPMGQRDFIFLNEPNIPQENLGKLWNNGIEFGRTFVQLANLAKAQFPGIRIWFSPMSPGGVSGDAPESRPQHKFIADANTQGALDVCWGLVCHAYTAYTADQSKAVNELLTEVATFQRMWSLKKPLILGEFSVNRPATANYKARVYAALYNGLRTMPGIQAAYSFTSSWYGGQDLGQWGRTWDLNQEGWKEGGIDTAFAALP